MISAFKTHSRLWLAPIFLGVGLILFVVILLTPSPSRAKPVVTWTPSSVSEIIPPGGSSSISVSFTASRNLTNIVVRIVPELQSFVVATPSSFAAVANGETKTIQLDLSTDPADPLLGSFVRRGTLHLRRGTTTLARPLPVSLFGLPPDPGEAGEATLEGIDSDGDGVRDDIQRFIALNHPNSARTRGALTQYATAMQQALLDADDKTNSIEHARESGHAIDCLYHIRSDDAFDASGELLAQMLNTDERNRTYFQYDGQLSGQFFPSTPIDLWKISCAFDPDALPN